ncbi:UvrD-helicase domain-containing protein [Croceitalea rosinachiae]|uniref:DNA 3'-5' helicase n=1 Tax=Croceitalea rosinachiae TaxID=3075596 RepID=A0ABU3A972_9FLAO|nr:UvrD-helicase domain-containing protein [Croceitalea sp. F388]MDT0606438.1 UvrD-helicase domain-containing protein [Croceitalea sp. F388]
MNTTGFKIYNASAGSGKTYQLTRRYLILVLTPKSTQKYAQLLAITFTNKAVGEMKQRILQNLYDFGLVEAPSNSADLFEEIKAYFNLTSEELRKKAKVTLKELLHNYAYFEISTIDKFNHKIIRTFARDLKIAQNFEVELDIDLLLNQAVARVLNKAGTNKKLTDFLIDFALEKIDDNRSWNIAYDLNIIGKILFRENHVSHLKKLENKNIDDFIALKNLLKLRIKKKQNGIVKKAQKNLELISEADLEFQDFSGKYFPKFMETISRANFTVNFNAGWKQNFETNPLYNKSCPENIKAIIDELQPEFTTNFNTIKEGFQYLSFLSKAYKKIVPLTLINEISKELKSIQEEQNLLNISEFNSIISNEIKNQPVPFIYERLGEKYRHYFIDEFQDTSQMQWKNLIPLIGNALESEDELGQRGSLLLVGDVKQAIYRWRGGEATQFLNLSLENENPFVVHPSIENLDKNWRSHDEVINFNNHFFTFIAKKLENNLYQKLYQEGNQQLKNAKSGGYVSISFLDADRQQETHTHCMQTLENIQSVLSKGFDYKDICILVRNNNQGVLIADFLSQNEVPLVSAEALLLKNSPEVNFLIALLYFIEQPQHKEYRFLILEYLADNTSLKHDFIAGNIQELEKFLSNVYSFKVGVSKHLPLLDLLELAIQKFNLVPKSNAYVAYLLDEVFVFGKKESNSIFDFLQYWERKKDKLSIVAPQNLNAVCIMTIHKSKGLEFPFVIFPFAHNKIDDKLKSNDLWVPVPEEDFNGFDELLLKNSSELEDFSEEAKMAYIIESNNSVLDDFNVLYVALTRAITGLFIISSPPRKSSTDSKNMSYVSLLTNYLKYLGQWEDSKPHYSFGLLEQNKAVQKDKNLQFSIPYIYTTKSTARFNMVKSEFVFINPDQQEAINTGNLLHKALSLIYTKADIVPSINELLESGEVNQLEYSYLEKIAHEIVMHNQLKEYYANNLIVQNEIEILNPSGSLVRPDRVIIKDKEVTIIDYKTGQPYESHKNQLEDYAAVFTKMGYFVSDKILVYINKTVKPIFV